MLIGEDENERIKITYFNDECLDPDPLKKKRIQCQQLKKKQKK